MEYTLMKTSELKKALEFMGFNFRDEEIYPNIYLVNWGDKLCASISRKFTNSYQIINTDCIPNTQLLRTLQDILLDYSATPIDERENQKKYHLKHRWLDFSKKGYVLGYNSTLDEYLIVTKFFSKRFKTEFTEKEIGEIKKRFNTTLDGFEMVEVRNEY